MEQKSRRLFVLAIAFTIVIGMLTSFGLPFFTQTPQINLSDEGGTPGTNPGDTSYDPGGAFIPITVTKDTVQAVVASMERSERHYRSVSIERWGSSETAATTTIQVWRLDHLMRVALIFPDGTSQNRLIDGSNIHVWHSGDRNYRTYPANQKEIDLAQELPTYELVAEMDPQNITDAYYDTKDGQACIYVEYRIEALDYLERCWISTETGLLIAVEQSRTSDGQLKYRMAETGISFDMEERLAQDASLFTLPDGTELN